jgi:hypothetical protein
LPGGLTFRFVAQPGHLSLYSRLLAASLRRFAPPGVVLQACVPEPMTLDSGTLAAFDRLEVQVTRFEPAIWRAHDYPIGNKVDIAALPADTGHVVVMDSDMIALRPFETDELTGVVLGMRPIMAPQVFVAENRPGIEAFVRARVAAAPEPERARLTAIRTPAEVGFPVFNSGFMVMRSGIGLGERLAELTRAVLAAEALAPKLRRPFADQLALACLALERPGAVTPLEKRWNRHVKTPPEGATLWHYFFFSRLARQPFGQRLLLSLQEEHAARGIDLLGEWSRRDLARAGRRDRS